MSATEVPAVAAPAAALAGVVVGGWLESRREHRRWLRERRYDVYRETHAAARTMLWRGDEIGSGAGDPAEQKEAIREAMRALRTQSGTSRWSPLQRRDARPRRRAATSATTCTTTSSS